MNMENVVMNMENLEVNSCKHYVAYVLLHFKYIQCVFFLGIKLSTYLLH